MTNIQYYKGAIDASGCISNGWNLVKPNYWMYFGISLLAMLMIACIPCVNIILLGPVLAGVYYTLLRAMRGEPVEFGMMFKGFEKFVPTFVVGLIQSIPGIIFEGVRYTADIGRIASEGVVFFILLNIAWTITFMFALPLMAEHDLSPIDAIKLSAKAGWGNLGGLVLLLILQFLICILGLLLLCVGVFFVIPIVYAATAFAYRQVFPMIDGPSFQTTPPSPDVYGGSFGRGV